MNREPRGQKLITAFLTVIFTAVICLADLSVCRTASAVELSAPLLTLTDDYSPVVLRGLKIFADDHFKFSFIVDQGDEDADADDYSLLINYFLAGLAFSEDDMWVNLSPDERDRIIPDEFAYTNMGGDMLAQDYLLKQLSASLTHPDTELGKKYWSEIHNSSFKTHNSETEGLGRIWILPHDAKIFEDADKVFVERTELKVESEQPLSFLPQLENEVNNGRYFSKVRQMYYSLLLASWFKAKLKDHLINKIYSEQNKISGIDTSDPALKEKIYSLYTHSFKDGVYDLVKKVKATGRIEKRHYFCGGLAWHKAADIAAGDLFAWDKKAVSSSMGNRALKLDITLNPGFEKEPESDGFVYGHGRKEVSSAVEVLKDNIQQIHGLSVHTAYGNAEYEGTVNIDEQYGLSYRDISDIFRAAYEAVEGNVKNMPEQLTFSYDDNFAKGLVWIIPEHGIVFLNRAIDDNYIFLKPAYRELLKKMAVFQAFCVFLNREEAFLRPGKQLLRSARFCIKYLTRQGLMYYKFLLNAVKGLDGMFPGEFKSALEFAFYEAQCAENGYIKPEMIGFLDDIFEFKQTDFDDNSYWELGRGAFSRAVRKRKRNRENDNLFFKVKLSNSPYGDFVTFSNLYKEAYYWKYLKEKGVYRKFKTIFGRESVAPAVRNVGIDKEDNFYLALDGMSEIKNMLDSREWQNLPASEKIYIFIQIAQFVLLIHDEDLLVNDLKLDNVYARSRVRWMVADLMLSVPGDVYAGGTYGLSPTEEHRGFASDVFTFAMMLYDAFFGRGVDYKPGNIIRRSGLRELIEKAAVLPGDPDTDMKNYDCEWITFFDADPAAVTEAEIKLYRFVHSMPQMINELREIYKKVCNLENRKVASALGEGNNYAESVIAPVPQADNREIGGIGFKLAEDDHKNTLSGEVVKFNFNGTVYSNDMLAGVTFTIEQVENVYEFI